MRSMMSHAIELAYLQEILIHDRQDREAWRVDTRHYRFSEGQLRISLPCPHPRCPRVLDLQLQKRELVLLCLNSLLNILLAANY